MEQPKASAYGTTYFLSNTGETIYTQETIFPLDISKSDMVLLSEKARNRGMLGYEYIAELCLPILETSFSSHESFMQYLSLAAPQKDCYLYFHIDYILFL